MLPRPPSQKAARDAVKKEALRRAGIHYRELNPGDTPAELRRVIEKLIGKADSCTVTVIDR